MLRPRDQIYLVCMKKKLGKLQLSKSSTLREATQLFQNPKVLPLFSDATQPRKSGFQVYWSPAAPFSVWWLGSRGTLDIYREKCMENLVYGSNRMVTVDWGIRNFIIFHPSVRVDSVRVVTFHIGSPPCAWTHRTHQGSARPLFCKLVLLPIQSHFVMTATKLDFFPLEFREPLQTSVSVRG